MSSLGKRWVRGPFTEEHRRKLSNSAIVKYARIPVTKRFKSESTNYQQWHKRMKRYLGDPSVCFVCDTTSLAKIYEWANLTGKYDDPRDYKRMCHSCHKRYDMKRRCAFYKEHGRWPEPQKEQWDRLHKASIRS